MCSASGGRKEGGDTLFLTQYPTPYHTGGGILAMFAANNLQICSSHENSQWQWDHCSCCLADPQTAHSDGVACVNEGATMVAKTRTSFVFFLWIRLSCQPQERLIGRRALYGEAGGIGRHRLLADLVLTIRHGIHLVYTLSTLGIHLVLVYMLQP